jgi:hypothetical protein
VDIEVMLGAAESRFESRTISQYRSKGRVMEGMVPLKYSLNNGIRMRPVEIGLEMHFLAVGF